MHPSLILITRARLESRLFIDHYGPTATDTLSSSKYVNTAESHEVGLWTRNIRSSTRGRNYPVLVILQL